MDSTESLAALQKKHRQQMADNRDKIKARKARTHRLIERGAIAESMIPDAENMTNEEFRQALYNLKESL